MVERSNALWSLDLVEISQLGGRWIESHSRSEKWKRSERKRKEPHPTHLDFIDFCAYLGSIRRIVFMCIIVSEFIFCIKFIIKK